MRIVSDKNNLGSQTIPFLTTPDSIANEAIKKGLPGYLTFFVLNSGVGVGMDRDAVRDQRHTAHETSRC